MNRAAIRSLAVLVAALAAAPPAAAHRLDECLQATRVSIDVDRIGLEVDLTPGVSIAGEVFAAVDSNGDGEISEKEADAYAQGVLGFIALAVDNRPAALTLVGHRFPARREMSLGTGTIRVSATASVPPAAGVRRLSYVNTFMPERSVYLANALVPSDDRVQITGQGRDVLQRSLMVDYRVSGGPSRVGWSLTALALFATFLARRRRSRADLALERRSDA